MKIGTTDWPEGIVNAWVYHRTLQLLGFPIESIVLGTGIADLPNKSILVGAPKTTQRCIVVVRLRVPGKDINISAAVWKGTQEEFVGLWQEFCAVLDSGQHQEDLQRAWEGTVEAFRRDPLMRVDALAVMLANQGVDVPLFQWKRIDSAAAEHATDSN
jgi:hypothetical protein